VSKVVTRTELTKRVEILEAQIIAQTNLTENVETLEAKVTNQEQTINNLSSTVSVLCTSLVDLQKKVAELPKKKTKRK